MRTLAVALALALASLSSAAALADTADLAAVPLRRYVLVQGTDDRWYAGRVTEASASHLVMKGLHRRRDLPAPSIARVWEPRPDMARAALIDGLGGLAGGALVEVALGPTCPSCGLEAGRVARTAAIVGAAGALSGLISGIDKGRWRRLVPAGAGGDGHDDPFAPWGVSVSGGAEKRSGGPGSSAVHAFGILGVWKNYGPEGSLGFEYGSLGGTDRRSTITFVAPSGPPIVYDTDERRVNDRWAFAAASLRGRASRGAVRPFVVGGVGAYIERVAQSDDVSDATGPLFRVSESNGKSWLGLNLGGGVSAGGGGGRGTLEARAHWAPWAKRFWLTGGLGAAFR